MSFLFLLIEIHKQKWEIIIIKRNSDCCDVYQKISRYAEYHYSALLNGGMKKGL
jgi:hypothetical protein